MLRIIFGILGASGLCLTFGGVSIIESAHDIYTMGVGFAVSVIGLMACAMFALASCGLGDS